MKTEYVKGIQNNEVLRKRLAKYMAHECFRNTMLEDFHGTRKAPQSLTGDYSVVGITVNGQTIASNAISDNKGNTYTKAAESIHTAFNNHVALFYAANVTGGSNFRVTSNIGDNTLSAQEYSGVATASPLDKVATSTGTSTTPLRRCRMERRASRHMDGRKWLYQARGTTRRQCV
jgi:hypothetical protein